MWPNETEDYRAARRNLLEKEKNLRALVEEVASDRRNLPDGGRIKENYTLKRAADDSEVRFSELFEADKNTLFVYSFMYAPDGAPCPMCTSMLDSLDKSAPHVEQQINMAVFAKAKPKTLKTFAESRSWEHLKLYSTFECSYNLDYAAENENDEQLPIMHVWQQKDKEIYHYWASELFYSEDKNWQHQPRHADMIWPLWNILDLTPDGRGDWYPSIQY